MNRVLAIRSRFGSTPSKPDCVACDVAWTGVALTLLSCIAWQAWHNAGATFAVAVLLGAGLGFALRRSGFGFAGPWRAMLVDRRGAGMRAQLGLLALLTIIFFPLMANGEAFGKPLFDIVRPVGVSLLAGAFLFGLGAQLASACSSGSFAAVGDGKFRYVIVAVGMAIGATIGSAHFGWWESQPRWISFSMVREWGALPGVVTNLAFIGVLAALTLRLERARHGRILAQPEQKYHLLKGPWPLSWGVIALALLCTVTLLVTGRPWTIITALPLWGAKLIEGAGLSWDVAFWEYWGSDTRMLMLEDSLWFDLTTLMIVGLVLGVMLAATLAGRYKLQWKITANEAIRAVSGGLLLGYGGLVGLGCNIGAFLAGVSSGSIHGWVWLAAAFLGSAAGVAILALTGRILGGRRASATTC